MDRPIEDHEIRARRLRRGGVAAGGLALLLCLPFGLRWWLQPHVDADRIRIGLVERGPVEAAILCSGTVVPGNEQVIPSPFDARVQRIFEQPGAALAEGRPLLQLDDAEVRLAVGRLEDQIALKENRRRELTLSLESRLVELEGQQRVQRERLAFLAAKTTQQRSLHDLGLTSIHELRQAELEERVATIELEQLVERSERERQTTRAQVEGLDIEMSLLRRDLGEQHERLERATVRADRDGVLTWISEEEGATVGKGEMLARVADLSRFRVEATVSDLHANRMAVGMPARVEISGRRLGGRVANIPPAISEGRMTLQVELEEPSSELLHVNQRVDVHVITDRRLDGLRVAKGPFVNGSGEQQVFVLRGDHAERVPAEIGVAGVDHYEIVSGLDEGDRVIVSAMADYLHLRRVGVR